MIPAELAAALLNMISSAVTAIFETLGTIARTRCNGCVPEHVAKARDVRKAGRRKAGLSPNGDGQNINRDRPEGRNFEGPSAPVSFNKLAPCEF